MLLAVEESTGTKLVAQLCQCYLTMMLFFLFVQFGQLEYLKYPCNSVYKGFEITLFTALNDEKHKVVLPAPDFEPVNFGCSSC